MRMYIVLASSRLYSYWRQAITGDDDDDASKCLGSLKRNILTKHSGIREAAFKTAVRPQQEYASTVWSPYTKQDIQKK